MVHSLCTAWVHSLFILHWISTERTFVDEFQLNTRREHFNSKKVCLNDDFFKCSLANPWLVHVIAKQLCSHKVLPTLRSQINNMCSCRSGKHTQYYSKCWYMHSLCPPHSLVMRRNLDNVVNYGNPGTCYSLIANCRRKLFTISSSRVESWNCGPGQNASQSVELRNYNKYLLTRREWVPWGDSRVDTLKA